MKIDREDCLEIEHFAGIAEGIGIATMAFFAYRLGFKRGRESTRPAHVYITSGGKRVKKMQLKDSDKLPLSLEVDDKFGHPTSAPLDAPPAWALADATLGTIEVSADGMSASVIPSGILGDTKVQVSALVGGKAFSGEMDLSIIPGDAAAIVIKPGDVVPQ